MDTSASRSSDSKYRAVHCKAGRTPIYILYIINPLAHSFNRLLLPKKVKRIKLRTRNKCGTVLIAIYKQCIIAPFIRLCGWRASNYVAIRRIDNKVSPILYVRVMHPSPRVLNAVPHGDESVLHIVPGGWRELA